ncbi:hypothetical protein LUZ60_010069 [Juncus effusus]|nr:hypothetical protein LUZ60_010069 [Juncus effusus]
MKLVFLFLVILFSSLENPGFVFGGTGNDTLFPGQSLSFGGRTLVSNNGFYQFGFFNIYGGHTFQNEICLVLLLGDNNFTRVWQANIDITLSDPVLNLTRNGDFVLLDHYAKTYKHIIGSSGNKTVSTNLVLLDSGNLVLRDSKNSSRIFWQSFDHPKNTWLPGARLGSNLSLISDGHYYDYAYSFSLEIDPSITRGFVIRLDSTDIMYHGVFPDWMDIREDSNHFVTFYDTKEYSHLYVNLHAWKISIHQWFNESYSKVLWDAPFDICDGFSICGPYGLCQSPNDVHLYPLCSCPSGFQPTSPQSWKSGVHDKGCSRIISWDCEITENSHYVDAFYLMENIIKFPDDSRSLAVRTEAQCEASCLRNCSCAAYSYNNSKCSPYGLENYLKPG